MKSNLFFQQLLSTIRVVIDALPLCPLYTKRADRSIIDP